MKIYNLEFDNDMEYDSHESYGVGVFDSYEKAESYCLSKGYEKTGTKGLFKKKDSFWSYHYNFLTINEIELNKIFNDVE